jgi:sugar diacid utilization regulator
VPTLQSLLASPMLSEVLSPVAGTVGGQVVDSVVLVEHIGDFLDQAGANALMLLTPRASAAATTYRFEIAVREAGARRVAAVVLTGNATLPLLPTSVALAERAGLVVLCATPGTDLAELVSATYREIRVGSETALARALAALDALCSAEKANLGVKRMLEAASTAFGASIEMREAKSGVPTKPASWGGKSGVPTKPASWGGTDGELSSPVLVDGNVRGVVVGHPDWGDPAATRIVLELTAGAVARTLSAKQRAEEIPARSEAELLTELLSSEPETAAPLLHRARALGLAIDGWHIIVRIELSNVAAFSDGNELAAFELGQAIEQLAHQTARASGGRWHRGRMGSSILLLRMERDDPGHKALAATSEVAQRVLRRLQSRAPGLVAYCGIGGMHAGPTGVRASAAEASAAVAAARLAGKSNVVCSFDEVGLRRTLIEWYASDTAREAVKSLLEPLERLGHRKAEIAIGTLQTYLDHQGSLSATAAALHLHRNAVAYRIAQILERLQVNIDDPDQRLLLQLACRARALRQL